MIENSAYPINLLETATCIVKAKNNKSCVMNKFCKEKTIGYVDFQYKEIEFLLGELENIWRFPIYI